MVINNCGGVNMGINTCLSNRLYKWIATALLVIFSIEILGKSLRYQFTDNYDYMVCDFKEITFRVEKPDVVAEDELFFTLEDDTNYYKVPRRACYQVNEKSE